MSLERGGILILTDGRPGHETQALGIAKILNYKNNFDIHYLKINHPRKLLKQLFKLGYTLFPKTWMLNFFMNPTQLSNEVLNKRIDFIISAGGDTLLPNALLKKYLISKGKCVRNIIATSLRGMPEHAYDVVFTIDAKKENQPPYLYHPIAPNKLISFNLEEEAKQARALLSIKPEQNVWSILIGADTQDVKIANVQYWVEMIRGLLQQYQDDTFLISTSRRTPAEFEQTLKLAFAESINVKLILVGEGDQTAVADLMYAANFIICSPDSTSMVSESLMLRKPVFIAQFDATEMSPEFEAYYADKQQKSWLRLSSMHNLEISAEQKKFNYLNHADIFLEKFNAI